MQSSVSINNLKSKLERSISLKEHMKKVREDRSEIQLNKDLNQTVINSARKQYFLSHFIWFFIAFFGIGVFIIDQEIYLENYLSNHNDIRLGLLIIGWILNIMLVVNIIMSYCLYVLMMQKEHLLYTTDGVINTGLWKTLIFEVFMNLISPLPFLYKSQYYELYLGQNSSLKSYVNTPIFWIWFIIRLYHLFRVTLESSYFMTPRAFRLWSFFGFRWKYMYALRWMFRVYGVHIVVAFYIFSTLIFGYMFRIAEYPLSKVKPSLIPFTFRNSLFFTIVTMTTVGYGDISPHTETGQIIGLICAFFGIWCTAFLVIAFYLSLAFSKAEAFAYELLENLEKNEDIKTKALNHILSFYILFKRK